MSEEIEKVTTEKQKNPGRQEWGRKLGKMQKELKLKKQNEERQESKLETAEDKNSNGFVKWEYVLTGVTLLLGVGALYYQKKRYECQLKMQQIKKPEVEKKEPRFSAF